jgi:membrane protein YdbS with pleckstrin-like domain
VGGALIIALLVFSRSVFWPGIAFRHAWWRADERGLRIRRGVIWRTEIFVPKSRVQHTDVSRGPIERGFGLAKLIMHTAGTHDASVVLEGLAEEDAFALRDFLIDVDGGDAV